MEDADDDDIDESCSSADHSFSSRHRVRKKSGKCSVT
jgi:hypothetical protein